MLHGIIDIGSNTVRLSIYKVLENSDEFTLILNQREMLGLVGLIENKKLSSIGIDKMISTLNNFKDLLTNLNILSVHIIATAIFRLLSNTDEVVDLIKEQTGLDISVISGEKEAYYDFLSVSKIIGINNGLIIDIGGGSTEIIPFDDHDAITFNSLAIGSLSLHTEFVDGIIPSLSQRKEIKECISSKLKDIPTVKIQSDTIFGIGGTFRSLLKIATYLYPFAVNGYNVDAPIVGVILKSIKKDISKSKNLTYFKELFKIIPDRILTITTGLLILSEIIEKYNIKSIHVCKFGVREGYLIDNIITNNNGADENE